MATRPTNQETEVLLVEDDDDIAQALCDDLGARAFSVSRVSTLAAAKQYLATRNYEAVLLDLTLPDGDGLDLAAAIRAAGAELPILMLTARDSVPDRLAGFEHGADDYVGKPFDVDELAARLRVAIRRAHAGQRHVLHYADLELDLTTRTARRGAIRVALSDRESVLLAFLLRHPEEPLSRQRILEEVWGDEVEADSNVLNVFVNLLRNKIEQGSTLRIIWAVRGVGYILSGKDPEELG